MTDLALATSEIRHLSNGKFQATPTGLVVTGNPTIEEWLGYGLALKDVLTGLHWLIGDWLNFGEHRYGEKYAQGLALFGFTKGTLKNDAWIAKKIPPEERRPELTLAHHKEVASLPPEDREAWYDQTVYHEWTVQELKEELRDNKIREANGFGPEVPTRERRRVEIIIRVDLLIPIGSDPRARAEALYAQCEHTILTGGEILDQWIVECIEVPITDPITVDEPEYEDVDMTIEGEVVR